MLNKVLNFNNKCVKTAKILGRAYLKQINKSDGKNKQELISKAFKEAAKLSITLRAHEGAMYMGEMILSADPENPSLQIKFSKLLWNNTVSIMKRNPCEATYKKSELYLQKILKLDPGNTKAIKMLCKVNLEIENLNIKN